MMQVGGTGTNKKPRDIMINALLECYRSCTNDTVRKHLKSAIRKQLDVELLTCELQCPTAPPDPGTTGLTQDELDILHDGQKIQCIKMIRNRTHLALKEAKELAERFQQW